MTFSKGELRNTNLLSEKPQRQPASSQSAYQEKEERERRWWREGATRPLKRGALYHQESRVRFDWFRGGGVRKLDAFLSHSHRKITKQTVAGSIKSDSKISRKKCEQNKTISLKYRSTWASPKTSRWKGWTELRAHFALVLSSHNPALLFFISLSSVHTLSIPSFLHSLYIINLQPSAVLRNLPSLLLLFVHLPFPSPPHPTFRPSPRSPSQQLSRFAPLSLPPPPPHHFDNHYTKLMRYQSPRCPRRDSA